MQDKPTLCWKCANACGGCSWSDGTFTPVDGWTAIQTFQRENHGGGYYIDRESFIVLSCPLFEDDTDQYCKPTRTPATLPFVIRRQNFGKMNEESTKSALEELRT